MAVRHHELTVRYSLDGVAVDISLNWSGDGDLQHYIQGHVPTELLKSKTRPPLDAGLVGLEGYADLEVPTPATERIP